MPPVAKGRQPGARGVWNPTEEQAEAMAEVLEYMQLDDGVIENTPDAR